MGTSSKKHSKLNKNFKKRLGHYVKSQALTSDNALSVLSITSTVVTGSNLITACVVGIAKGLIEGSQEYSNSNDLKRSIEVGTKEGLKEAGKELVYGTMAEGIVDIVGSPNNVNIDGKNVSREARIVVEECIERGLDTGISQILNR